MQCTTLSLCFWLLTQTGPGATQPPPSQPATTALPGSAPVPPAAAELRAQPTPDARMSNPSPPAAAPFGADRRGSLHARPTSRNAAASGTHSAGWRLTAAGPAYVYRATGDHGRTDRTAGDHSGDAASGRSPDGRSARRGTDGGITSRRPTSCRGADGRIERCCAGREPCGAIGTLPACWLSC